MCGSTEHPHPCTLAQEHKDLTREAVDAQGLRGALTGGLKAAAGGVTAAVFFSTLAAMVFRPRDKS